MHLLKVGLLMIQGLAMHVSEGLRCLKCRKSYFIVGTPKYSLSLRSGILSTEKNRGLSLNK